LWLILSDYASFQFSIWNILGNISLITVLPLKSCQMFLSIQLLGIHGAFSFCMQTFHVFNNLRPHQFNSLDSGGAKPCTGRGDEKFKKRKQIFKIFLKFENTSSSMHFCHFKCVKYANTPSIWSPGYQVIPEIWWLTSYLCCPQMEYTVYSFINRAEGAWVGVYNHLYHLKLWVLTCGEIHTQYLLRGLDTLLFRNNKSLTMKTLCYL
jgi:hypothetical protein